MDHSTNTRIYFKQEHLAYKQVLFMGVIHFHKLRMYLSLISVFHF